MSTLPIDRTNLNLAVGNQVPSHLLQSALNINAISTLYDGSDAIYNYVLSVVAAYTAVGGAASIGTSAITGLTTANVQAMLAEIEAQVQAIVAGSVPAGTITTAMIQNLAVTAAKIADGTITATKLAADIQAKINQIYANEREIANLKAASSIANRVDGASGIFFDLNDGLNGGSAGKIDNTKTNSTGTIAVSAGTIVVPVLATTGFTVGQEVTIFDDVNLERRIITAINAGVSLSFAAMTNSYKTKAQICRSSVIQDTVNKLLKFGGWSYLTTVTNTAVSVVASAYDTSGNGGRKIVGPLTNGWLIAIEVNGTTIQVQKSIDNGATWTALCNISGMQVGAAATFSGNKVTVICNSTTVVYSVTFDASTVTNIDLNSTKVSINAQTSVNNNMSVATSPNGTLNAVWSGITSAYPNSNNLCFAKSVDSGVTWTNQAGSAGFVDRFTTNNVAGTDITNPCIVVTSNNYQHIVAQSTPTTAYSILAWNWNGSTWTASAGVSIYAGTTYSQSNPCAAVAPSGRIWCAWQGLDATDTTQPNVRYSYSDDGGVTWLTAVKLTSGNTYGQSNPSMSIDKNNNVYVLWNAPDAVSSGFGNLFRNIWTGTAFQGVTKLTTNTTANAQNPSPVDNNTLDFNLLTPPMIYKDLQATAVKFSGTYIAGTSTPVLVEDVRYNINPPTNVSSAVAWVDHDADANYSIAGAVSFQAGGGNESFSSMTKSTAAIDGTHNEDQFTGSGTSAAKATLRLTLTRNSTALIKNISSVMGAVGA